MAALSAPDRMAPDPSAQLLRPDDVAGLLGVTTRTVRRLGETGSLTRIKLGRRSTRYRLADVLAYIDSCTTTSNAAPTGDVAMTRGTARDHERL